MLPSFRVVPIALIREKHLEQCWVSRKWLKNISHCHPPSRLSSNVPETFLILLLFGVPSAFCYYHLSCYIVIINVPIFLSCKPVIPEVQHTAQHLP